MYTVKDLFDLDKTIASKLFENAVYPWEVLGKIKSFIIELGNTLPADKFEKLEENVWAAKDAVIAPTAFIGGPCIIDSGAEMLALESLFDDFAYRLCLASFHTYY